MKTMALVARREILERRSFFVAALFVGFFPVIFPLLPMTRDENPAELRGTIAVVLAIMFPFAGAVGLGTSMFARPLGDGKLGFFLGRPIPLAALFAGKLAGAVCILLAFAALGLIPSFLVGRFALSPDFGFDQVDNVFVIPALTFAAWLLTIGLTHFLTVSARSRSAFVALDAAAAVLTGYVAWKLGARMLYSGSPLGLKSLAIFGASALLLASFGAMAFELVRGLADLRASRRAMSAFFWGVIALAAGFAMAATGRWLSPPISGAKLESAEPIGERFVAVTGAAAGRDFSSAWLVGREDGSVLPIGSTQFVPIVASSSGKYAIFGRVEKLASGVTTEILRADLSAKPIRFEPTKVFVSGWMSGLALSDDGRTVAINSGGSISIQNLDSGDVVAAASVPGQIRFLRLLAPDRVRLYVSSRPSGAGELRIFEVGPRSKVETGVMGPLLDKENSYLRLAPEGDRVLLVSPWGRAELRDGRSGALITVIATPVVEDDPEVRLFGTRFLADGRIAVLRTEEGNGSRARFELRDSSGALIEEKPIALSGGVPSLGWQVSENEIVLFERRESNATTAASTSAVLDLHTGIARPLGNGLRPQLRHGLFNREITRPPAVGSFVSRLFDTEAGPVEVDPATGVRRAIVRK